VLGIMAARSLDPERFGAFSLAFLTFAFVLNASRGVSTDPLLVRFSGARSDRWGRAVSGAGATALVAGVLSGVACVGVGLLLPAPVGPGFVALGVGLPGVLLQDSYRFGFFSCGQGERAFVNDLVWGALQVSGLVLLALLDELTVVSCLLVFGATGTVAAGLGALQARVLPDPRLVPAWLSEHRDLGARYLVENLSIGGARQFRMTLVALIAGLAAVGQIRAAEIMMGPLLVLLAGVSQVSVPEAKQVLTSSPRRLRTFCAWLASGQALLAAAWGVAVYLLMPLGLGALLLGGDWRAAHALLPPVVVLLTIGCFEIGAAAGVRALGASRRSLRAQLATASMYVTAGGLGAAVGGAPGSCWGVALSTVAGAGVWWYHLRKALLEHVEADR
jgi:O-antigen/teichoic acid export membrane protein